jgi:hypothetical protein
MQMRIGAIAQLYDLISRSSRSCLFSRRSRLSS